MASFLKNGAQASGNGLLTEAPPNTGAGWYSLATGAWPGVHGSTNNTFHINGGVFANSTSSFAPGVLKGTSLLLSLVYVVLAMPFAYRAIDAGLRALDLKTIVEASNSLGAGWGSTLWRVILPNLRTALLSATVLTVALVLGEFTIASLDLYQTFPVWIYVNSQTSGQVSVAASLLALFVTWVFLLVITVLGSRQSRKTGGGEVTLFSVARTETRGD